MLRRACFVGISLLLCLGGGEVRAKEYKNAEIVALGRGTIRFKHNGVENTKSLGGMPDVFDAAGKKLGMFEWGAAVAPGSTVDITTTQAYGVEGVTQIRLVRAADPETARKRILENLRKSGEIGPDTVILDKPPPGLESLGGADTKAPAGAAPAPAGEGSPAEDPDAGDMAASVWSTATLIFGLVGLTIGTIFVIAFAGVAVWHHRRVRDFADEDLSSDEEQKVRRYTLVRNACAAVAVLIGISTGVQFVRIMRDRSAGARQFKQALTTKTKSPTPAAELADFMLKAAADQSRPGPDQGLKVAPAGAAPAGTAAAPAPGKAETPIERDLREARGPEGITRSQAIGRLQTDYKVPDKERQAEVAALLMERMNAGDPTAAAALLTWATPKELEQVPQLLGHRDLSLAAIAILGKFQVTSEAANVASFLKTSRKEAADALIAMGPGAEPAVLPYLDDRDFSLQREACYILQRIGTNKSLPYLESLSHARIAELAQSALLASRAIRKRENLPEPVAMPTANAPSTPASALARLTPAGNLAGATAKPRNPSAEWTKWAGEWKVYTQKKFSHGSGVQSIAFSATGRHLATGNGAAVRLWDLGVSQPRLKGELTGLKAAPRAMLYLPDDKGLVLGMDDHSLRFLNLSGPKAPQQRQQLKDQKGAIMALALSPDGKTVAAGSDDMTIALYTATSIGLEQLQVLKVVNADFGVKQLRFLPDGKSLVCVTGSGDVRLWDLTANPPRDVARMHVTTSSFTAVADLSPDGKTLAAADDNNRSVGLWTINAAPPQFTRQQTWRNVTSLEMGALAFSPHGPILAGTDLGGRVILWNTDTLEKAFDKQSPGEYRSLEFGPFQGRPTDTPRLRLVVASRSSKGDVNVLDVTPSKK